MKHFTVLKKDSDEHVAAAATILEDFATMYENNELSESEYKELSLDVLDMQRIDDMALDLARKTKIAKAFAQLVQIVKFIV